MQLRVNSWLCSIQQSFERLSFCLPNVHTCKHGAVLNSLWSNLLLFTWAVSADGQSTRFFQFFCSVPFPPILTAHHPPRPPARHVLAIQKTPSGTEAFDVLADSSGCVFLFVVFDAEHVCYSIYIFLWLMSFYQIDVWTAGLGQWNPRSHTDSTPYPAVAGTLLPVLILSLPIPHHGRVPCQTPLHAEALLTDSTTISQMCSTPYCAVSAQNRPLLTSWSAMVKVSPASCCVRTDPVPQYSD